MVSQAPQMADLANPEHELRRSDPEVVYRGLGAVRSEPLVVVVEGGQVTGPLPHIVKHSPGGFAWGYAGSGPAELARCLIIHALDLGPDCEQCQGSGSRCFWCDGGYTRPTPRQYQQFKFDVIAALPMGEGWELSRDSIRAWMAAHPAAEGD